jgi:SOS-response transcriptional repressor LexA
MPVPVAFCGVRSFAALVRGYEFSEEGILPGDVVLIDPDRPAMDNDLAAVTLTMGDRRGRVLRRITSNGTVLESSNPDPRYAPIRLTAHSQAVVDGAVVAVVRRL